LLFTKEAALAKDRHGAYIKLGSKVEFFGSDKGIVVCDIDNNGYTKDFPSEVWSYLGSGVLVKSKEIGIIHFNSLNGQIDDLTVGITVTGAKTPKIP
jgi:hypothetical protein